MKIDLLQFQDLIRTRRVHKETFIHCVARRRFVKLTPEEMVRQLMLQYLINECKYSQRLIKVEHVLHVNKQKKRADIVVYNRKGSPFLCVECKSAAEPINQQTFNQIAAYNMALKVPYLVITNGQHTIACSLDTVHQSINLISTLPDQKEME